MDRAARLKGYLQHIARNQDGGLDAIGPAAGPPSGAPGVESFTEELEVTAASSVTATVDVANQALDKVKSDPEVQLAPEEMSALEAIIIPRERPAIDVVRGDFRVVHDKWLDLNEGPVHQRLTAAIPAIGRIDLPGQTQIPYGGTGFIVGPGLLMTNRHVAQIFASGLGAGPIIFRPGWQSAIDFLHERGQSGTDVLRVRGVRMIHPFWDMALLEVEVQGTPRTGLKLSLKDIGEMDGHRVAVIGYPAFDPERNDIATQNRLFDSAYGVKRLQPGELGPRRNTSSFGKIVSAGTHDASTLGGNSGSAVIDLDTGEVLALHFGGRYLDTNYCVPAFELAKDGRVVDAGVEFAGTASGGFPPWSGYWTGAEALTSAAGMSEPDDIKQSFPPVPPAPGTSGAALPPQQEPVGAGGEISFTVPLTVTIQLGRPIPAALVAALPAAQSVEAVQPIEEALVQPWHDPDYAGRDGYDETFLEDLVVPMPHAKDRSVIAPLLDGGDTLHYRHFSIQMHAKRRLALFTASNVTAEAALKRPEPGKKYDRKSLAGLGPNDQEKWFPDPRIAAQFQLSDKFYTKDRGSFDKGHIVRREDPAWGHTYKELRQANGDTYHVTNCSPQVAPFNQSQRGEGNWGDLENMVLTDAATERLCLFAGPILDDSDPIFTGVDSDGTLLHARIPKAFWKVIVAKVATGAANPKAPKFAIATYAFVLEQDISNVELEFAVSDIFRKKMVSLSELELRTGLIFDADLHDGDQFGADRGSEVAFHTGAERVVSLRPPDIALQPEILEQTPNSGDDESAAQEAGAPAYEPETTEALRPWRLAEGLNTLRTQINALAPRRSKVSDGTIGDAAHQSRSSDHNPWVIDGDMGVVTAIDVTHDPAGGCDGNWLAETLRANADKRIKYVIWNRRIASRDPIGGAAAWAWRPYTGKNPHDHHVHVSVRSDKQYYDLATPWVL